jgi:hypothetical protein
MSASQSGGIQLLQRYELAARLCTGLRVLDLSEAPERARSPLASAARELVRGTAPAESFDAVVALDGLPDAERRERVLSDLERWAARGAGVIVALERPGGRPTSPRVEAPFDEIAKALAKRLPGALVMPQFVAEGSLIGAPPGEPGGTPELDLRMGDESEEGAAALIIASGFERGAVSRARLSLRVVASPVLLSYVRALEVSNAELLRANRGLMSANLGRDGSAAASLANAQHQAEKMRELARHHELHARRVEAWYDAPRYHLADRVREFLIKVPGLARTLRFLWSLISTRAETPQLDAAANPVPNDEEEGAVAVVTREPAGLTADELHEGPEASARLEP